jgi:hypothetical protein
MGLEIPCSSSATIAAWLPITGTGWPSLLPFRPHLCGCDSGTQGGRERRVPYLSAYFQSKFYYELDESSLLGDGNVINILDWRFGSYRCQARAS